MVIFASWYLEIVLNFASGIIRYACISWFGKKVHILNYHFMFFRKIHNKEKPERWEEPTVLILLTVGSLGASFDNRFNIILEFNNWLSLGILSFVFMVI